MGALRFTLERGVALTIATATTGTKTKRDAVVKALVEFHRRKRVDDLAGNLGTLDFASNDQIEAGDLAEIARTEVETGKR